MISAGSPLPIPMAIMITPAASTAQRSITIRLFSFIVNPFLRSTANLPS
jgi:hypothetical protein